MPRGATKLAVGDAAQTHLTLKGDDVTYRFVLGPTQLAVVDATGSMCLPGINELGRA
jgi:hypothetical protein